MSTTPTNDPDLIAMETLLSVAKRKTKDAYEALQKAEAYQRGVQEALDQLEHSKNKTSLAARNQTTK